MLLKDATSVDTSAMERIERPQPPPAPPIQMSGLEPGYNVMQRCPMPPIAVTPDSLRQYYQGGVIPQARVLTPGSVAQKGSGVTTITNNVTTAASSSSSSSTTTDTSPVTAGYTTQTLGAQQVEQGTIELVESFDVLQVSVDTAARVQLYANAAFQQADLTRGRTPPSSTTQHGVIFDLYLDGIVAALNWVMSPVAVGANADDPAGSTLYLSVTNLSPGAAAINVSITYEVS